MSQSQWDMGDVASHSYAEALNHSGEIWGLGFLFLAEETEDPRVLDDPGTDGRASINLHPYAMDGAELS